MSEDWLPIVGRLKAEIIEHELTIAEFLLSIDYLQTENERLNKKIKQMKRDRRWEK